jgi:hypothetical protein
MLLNHGVAPLDRETIRAGIEPLDVLEEVRAQLRIAAAWMTENGIAQRCRLAKNRAEVVGALIALEGQGVAISKDRDTRMALWRIAEGANLPAPPADPEPPKHRGRGGIGAPASSPLRKFRSALGSSVSSDETPQKKNLSAAEVDVRVLTAFFKGKRCKTRIQLAAETGLSVGQVRQGLKRATSALGINPVSRLIAGADIEPGTFVVESKRGVVVPASTNPQEPAAGAAPSTSPEDPAMKQDSNEAVLNALIAGPLARFELQKKTGLEMKRLQGTLSRLQLAGRVKKGKGYGAAYSLTSGAAVAPTRRGGVAASSNVKPPAAATRPGKPQAKVDFEDAYWNLKRFCESQGWDTTAYPTGKPAPTWFVGSDGSVRLRGDVGPIIELTAEQFDTLKRTHAVVKAAAHVDERP